ncbi:type II CAAX prenyl endopeptidase Rce1 family protein [Dyella sp. KRB-257]|uniref:CPBP family glutamic-type intramembrane protease n=1 Tax=Dyella sp. KRB-257 TaxID=3400915 RepID=UPI003C04F5C3
MASSARGILVKTGWLLAVVAALLAFRLLAGALTARHLAREAHGELALLRAGQPLWRWTFTTTEDLVAGRAFGHADVQAVDDGLRITSRDGTPFDLGLPIARGVDLMHWPILHLDRRGKEPVALSILWQAPGSATCASAPMTWRDARLDLDLRAVDASAPGSGHCALPANAGMLRLRLTMTRGQELVLRKASLRAADPPALVPTPQDLAGSFRPRSGRSSSTAVPIVRLHATASAEQMLARRDEALAWRPAAIVIVDGTSLAGSPPRPMPRRLSWLATTAYVLMLLALSRRPRAALPTLLAGMLGPLVLIAGLQWGQRPSVPGVIALGAALAFAFRIQHQAAPPNWRWVGAWRSAGWRWPLALIPVALSVCLIWGHALEPVPLRRALVYFGWAALQQWLVLGFALGQLGKLLPVAWAVLAAAALFALLHVPNGALMQLCFLAELWWAWCFTRQRALLPIALAHAACALLVGAGLVGNGLRSLEVSARFFL